MPNHNSPFKQNFNKKKSGPGLSTPGKIAKGASSYANREPVLRQGPTGNKNKKPLMQAGNKNPALGGGMSYTDMNNAQPVKKKQLDDKGRWTGVYTDSNGKQIAVDEKAVADYAKSLSGVQKNDEQKAAQAKALDDKAKKDAGASENKTPDVEFGEEDGFDKNFWEKWEKLGKSLKPKFSAKDQGNPQEIEKVVNKHRFNDAFMATRKRLESYAIKSSIYGIGGMPATFLDNTDPPLPGAKDGLGYQYINTVIRYGTFIAFQPGFITWNIKLDGLDLNNLVNPQNVAYLQKKVIGGGIDFNQPKLKEYWLEVARHDRMAILLMGIQDMGIVAATFGTKSKGPQYGGGLDITNPQTKTFSFNNFSHQNLANLGLGLADSVIQGVPMAAYSQGGSDDEKQSSGFVVFYVDGPIQATDTISNQAEPSEFKTSINELLGDTSAVIKEVMGKTLGAFNGSNALLTFLGGNAIIPDVWKDTSYQKSYTFTIRLVSASGDPVSVFMNIIHQLVKLLCLATPLGTGGFYSSAPILRVFSQGVINTEYGLIESMTINRKMETLNDYGMPTEVDVEITLRDLNAYIYREMPGWFESGMTLSSSMSTFLATICGMNVTTLTRTQKMNLNKQMYEQYMKNEGTFKNIMDRKFQAWADIAENGMYNLQESAQSIKLAASRSMQLLKEAPRDIGVRVGSAGKTIQTGAQRAVGSVAKGFGIKTPRQTAK